MFFPRKMFSLLMSATSNLLSSRTVKQFCFVISSSRIVLSTYHCVLRIIVFYLSLCSNYCCVLPIIVFYLSLCSSYHCVLPITVFYLSLCSNYHCIPPIIGWPVNQLTRRFISLIICISQCIYKVYISQYIYQFMYKPSTKYVSAKVHIVN